MSVPKQHHTKGRRDRKRKRFAIIAKNTRQCPKCGVSIAPHRVCSKCGFYKGREVVDTIKKAKKGK